MLKWFKKRKEKELENIFETIKGDVTKLIDARLKVKTYRKEDITNKFTVLRKQANKLLAKSRDSQEKALNSRFEKLEKRLNEAIPAWEDLNRLSARLDRVVLKLNITRDTFDGL